MVAAAVVEEEVAEPYLEAVVAVAEAAEVASFACRSSASAFASEAEPFLVVVEVEEAVVEAPSCRRIASVRPEDQVA